MSAVYNIYTLDHISLFTIMDEPYTVILHGKGYKKMK